MNQPWLALDVGGANLKAAHSNGQARSLPFELWKYPDGLAHAIGSLLDTLPPTNRVALTMTAELCDCYPTKAFGVRAVLDAVLQAAKGQTVVVWGVDSQFHSVEEIQGVPRLAAASNWLALATMAARLIPEGPGLLIDIGSTTTDLIPLHDGRVMSVGRTDTERLQTGELVYVGVRRTPICALTDKLPYRGQPTALMAELFATTLDVYLTLGEIQAKPLDISSADGRPATTEAARDRLARMVGADRDTFDNSDALTLAQGADEALIQRLIQAACLATGQPVGQVVVAGSGEFLARRLAARILQPGGTMVSLAEAWGPMASSAACAHALVVLAQEWVEAGGAFEPR